MTASAATSMNRHRSFSTALGVVLLLQTSLSACNPKDDQIETRRHQDCTSSSSAKLKLGLAALVDTYNCEGEQSAIAFARENGIALEQGEVPVHIYTTGDRSEAFVADLKELGLDSFNASSLHNIVWANLPIGRLQELAGQDFVVYIVPAATTRVEP